MQSLSRRQFLRLTTLVAAGTALAACAKPTATPAPTAAPTAKPAATVAPTTPATTGFPITTTKVTLKFFAPHNTAIENYDTNLFVTDYEKKTGVHIEWNLVPPSGLTEKKNLAFASGELPDAFYGAGVSATECVDYGGQGLLIPIEGLIDKYNPECKKVFADPNGGALGKKLLTAPDGHMYQYPNYTFCYHCTYPQKFWMSQRWLDKAKVKLPTTTDEFYEVLKAFKAAIPTGSPMSASKDWSTWANNWLTGAFVMDNHDNHLVCLDGKVSFAANQTAYKDAMKFLVKLWKEGLIDKDAFTQDVAGLRQKIQAVPDSLVGCAPHMHYLGLCGADTEKTDERADEYVVLPPLKGPAGVRTSIYAPYVMTGGKYVITKACKNPDIAARWVDWFYTEDGLMAQKYGRENVEWYHPKAESGEMGHGEGLGPIKARFNWMPGKGWTETLQNITMNQQGPIYETREFRGSWTSTPTSPLEPRLVAATDTYVGTEMKEIWPAPMFKKEEMAEIKQIMTQVNDYTTEMAARFMTGDQDVDKQWDTYVKSLDSMGLAKYLEANQKAYARFRAS